jgi:hypothetical protein
MKPWKEMKPYAIFGLGALAGALAVLGFFALFAPNLSRGTFNNMSVIPGPQPPAPISTRVHSVVTEWSGSIAFANTDQLTDIWNQTRDAANHDYPFDQGGSDGLARLLNNEFKHAPKADITLTAENFEPNGTLKTVAQLVSIYSAHVA